MIRGLMHRQILGVVEGGLWVALVAIGASALYGIYASGQTVDVTPITPEIETVELNEPVRDRSHYDLIMQSQIFGAAAAYDHDPPKAPPPPPKPKPVEKVKTSLPLELKGLLFNGEESPFSSATIDVKEKGVGSKTLFIGEEIIDNVYLVKVLKDSVELDNKRANRRETLNLNFDLTGQPNNRMAAKPAPTPDANRATSAPTRRRPASQSLVTLERDDIVKKLEDDYERLASTVDVKEVKDDDGNVKGLTADNIESIPSLNELGFKNGDVLVSVNNENVTSQDQITQIANKYRNATIVRVGILRGGQPMSFTYRVRG